jgi:hypothetical protein
MATAFRSMRVAKGNGHRGDRRCSRGHDGHRGLASLAFYSVGMRPVSTRSTASRSTFLRFLRAASRMAPCAMRSMSRSAPVACLCVRGIASAAKMLFSAPASASRCETYSAT